MMRLSYLIPRLIILCLLAFAVLASKDSLIKKTIVSKLQDTIGAKVELGQLRCSLRNKKLFIKDLAIANPNDPMTNLFQADMAYIDLNASSLLSRRIVIDHSQTSNVIFGAPRLSSGALEGSDPKKMPLPYKWFPQKTKPIGEIGLSWLDKLPLNSPQIAPNTELAISKVANQYLEFWPQALENQKLSIAGLEQKTSRYKEITQDQEKLTNPLRPIQINPHVVFTEISTSTAAIQTRLNELNQALATNRLALHNAYQKDLLQIRAPSSQSTKFDSESVNELLLTELEARHIGEIIGWFHWFRQALPDTKTDFRPRAKRGIDVKIPSTVRKPGFLIKSIDLEGDGRFANQHTSFAGTAYNLSNEPELHDEPVSFVIRAQGQGENHVMLNCVLDRRGDSPVDTMNIVCPSLELESQLLGDEKSLLVTMGSQSRLQAEINIQAIDNQLSGEIVFRHSNVALHVDKLNDLAGGKDTALQLNQGLASLDNFTTKITLSGSIENYQYVMRSDLGDQFARAVDSVLSNSERKHFAKSKLMLEQKLNSELQKLNNQIAPEIEALNKQLNAKTVEVADLRKSLPQLNNGTLQRPEFNKSVFR